MSHTEQMREAFEAEMRCVETWGHQPLKRKKCGRYDNWRVDLMWSVWQAALTAPAAKCATCNGHGLVGGFMQDGSGYGEGCPDCNPEPAPAAEVPEAMGDEPALPEPVGGVLVGWRNEQHNLTPREDYFTADQLRTYAKQYARWQSTRLRGGVPEGEQRNREADRARFPDPNFNRWLDEAITENGEYTAWHALQSTGDAYAGWCVRPDYTGPAPEGHALVPVEPTPEMIEAARNVKRQRLARAAADIKKGKHPDTIGMALSVNEEWTAMLTAAPQAPAAALDAGVVRDACKLRYTPDWKAGADGLPYQASNFACKTCGYVGKHDTHPGCKRAALSAAQAGNGGAA